MAQATFSYEGINIGAIVERDEDIQWLTEFLVPWFDISDDIPDVEVRVTCDPERFEQLITCGHEGTNVNAFMMDTKVIAHPIWNGPDEQLTLYDEKHSLFYLVTAKHIQLIFRDHGASTRLRIMRVLRELAMGIAQLTGGRFLHASSFVANNRAAIITGPRHAGKTSLLSYILSSSTADLLSNDRLLINMRDQTATLRGMPTIVSIRNGTMDLLPALRRSIISQGFVSRATIAEARQSKPLTSFPAKEGRHGISPRQFCSLLGCGATKEASGTILLLPRQSGRPGGIQLNRLSTSEARIRLGDCLFGHIGPNQLSDVFTILPRRLSRKATFDDETLCAGLADVLPVFDCELGNDAYKSDTGAMQILQLLDNTDISRQAKPANPASGI